MTGLDVASFVSACLVSLSPMAMGEDAARPLLLSHNASYHIIGETYLYAGQNIPGTNETTGNAEGFRTTPLIELTDPGDALIDGDVGTIVYTPWSVRDNCKRITVEMRLSGPSRVSRVVVRLPSDPALR